MKSRGCTTNKVIIIVIIVIINNNNRNCETILRSLQNDRFIWRNMPFDLVCIFSTLSSPQFYSFSALTADHVHVAGMLK